jgi:FKBP-type peptidyl-prolyl cis-trans isomerase SlpA
LAEPLEQCLLGLTEGAHQVFELEPDRAFGARNAELVRRISRRVFDENTDPQGDYGPGDLVEFNAPGGGRIAGVLKEITEEHALFDFNHPLAGQQVIFEVRILGVL